MQDRKPIILQNIIYYINFNKCGLSIFVILNIDTIHKSCYKKGCGKYGE